MTKTYVNVVDASATGFELTLEQLDAVNGGNRLVDFIIGHVGGKIVDKAVDALKKAGPAPQTEHGSIYTPQPAGFVG